MSNIEFGTDGWRAVLGKDFNYENTDKVINAIACYIFSEEKFNSKIIIGYDPRNKADEFASYIAEKLAFMGFDIELSSKVVATPVLAYCALNRNAYAIMITASHNPPEYLGIKFILKYGGPADNPTIEKIVNNLEKTFNNNITPKTPRKVSFNEEYINHISKIIDFKKIKHSKIEINYDGHHGAGAKLFKEIIDDNKIKNISINLERDINFGGFMPDPKEKYLPELKKLCKQNNNIGFSNDGDGDRFGVFNEKGEFVSANEIIIILLKHLIENKGLTGKIAKTVGASSIIDCAAKKLNIKVIETPVGFKYLSEVMRNEDVIIAGEESGGLSIKNHIPEKDGIIANLLVIEAIAFYNKKLYELQEDVKELAGKSFFNSRTDLKLDSKKEQDDIIEKFKNYEKIGSLNIVRKNTLDGLKLYLEDGSSILIRKSGTEPLLRVYFESDKEEKIKILNDVFKILC